MVAYIQHITLAIPIHAHTVLHVSKTNRAWAGIVVFAAEVLSNVTALTTVLGDIAPLKYTI